MTKIPLPDLDQPVNYALLEEAVLSYWDEVDAFARSVQERPASKPYVFYDGPPFATGTPHYGHLLGSVMKDIVPRFWTMQGFRVERRWGWDCHGLPIENIIEKELNLQGGKKGIEAYGIKQFNDACRSAILRFDADWKKVIRRLGRWVDMENSYKTMDLSFMESVWWGFKTLYDKGLIYQGRKIILYCPRCSTPLSNFEIAMDNSYQDVEDHSLIVKFPLRTQPHHFFLAWTTTPWTLIGNVGLAIDPQATYVQIKQGDEFYYLAEARLEALAPKATVTATLKGQDLVSKNYQPLYSYLPLNDQSPAHFVAAADFVSLTEGTGIVHTAAMYGEDDYRLAQTEKLPLVDMLDDQGKFLPFVTPLKGIFYKQAETWIVDDLSSRSLLFSQTKLVHSYPFCYRCQTPLYYNAVPAWFIDIQKLKPELVKHNQAINWYPAHLKQGRFGKGLMTAPDWNISRSRYWGTPMPVWHNPNYPGKLRLIGSLAELKKWAVDSDQAAAIQDLHRENLDDLELWLDDERTLKGRRIPEVFDCWVESGSMSFAEHHYPFANKAKFEARFPAQYIVEYIAQTRAWFYTLHVMAVALFGKPAFQNALTTGTIMAEDGSKMSKSKKNYPDPLQVIHDFGVDSLRLYFASSPVMKTAQNVNFSRETINDIRKKTLNLIWNVFKFYHLYNSTPANSKLPPPDGHIMDRWLISLTQSLHQTVSQAMKDYEVVTASRNLMDYVQALSTWYLRLSRDRLRQPADPSQGVLVTAIKTWCLLAAPIIPFITEVIYQHLPGPKLDSIHLELWPTADLSLIDDQLEAEMVFVRQICEKAHALRQAAGIKVRQPLATLTVKSPLNLRPDLIEVLKTELNVKAVILQATPSTLEVELDLKLTPELKQEGETRDFIRTIMNQRKILGIDPHNWIDIEAPTWPQPHTETIKTKVKAKTLSLGSKLKVCLHSSV